jgi:hypothetical protein
VLEIGAVPSGGRSTTRPDMVAGDAASMALRSTVTWACAAKPKALSAEPNRAARSMIVVAPINEGWRLTIIVRRSR